MWAGAPAFHPALKHRCQSCPRVAISLLVAVPEQARPLQQRTSTIHEHMAPMRAKLPQRLAAACLLRGVPFPATHSEAALRLKIAAPSVRLPSRPGSAEPAALTCDVPDAPLANTASQPVMPASMRLYALICAVFDLAGMQA